MPVLLRPDLRPSALDGPTVRARFDAPAAFTVGVEEEVLLVDPTSFEPVACSTDVVAAAADPRVKPEMPDCQVELASRPHASAASAVAELGRLRTVLAEACARVGVVPAAAAVHPRVASAGPSDTRRHRTIEAAYGEVARRQLVGSLQVHVAVGSADATLAVYNALRAYLPELAALAASAPFYEGRDTGLASIRPVVCGQLPRQGVPPEIASWEAFADDLAWGAAAGALPDAGRWWWELRPHVGYGTLEVRVPDAQATLGAASAVVSVVHALVRWLAERHLGGEVLDVPPTWRIAENRWTALRDGVGGRLADLRTGATIPTRTRLGALLELIEPHAPDGLDAARALTERNGADDLRAVGPSDAAAWLVERFATDLPANPQPTTPDDGEA
jgi:carboxylate-amine ligase